MLGVYHLGIDRGYLEQFVGINGYTPDGACGLGECGLFWYTFCRLCGRSGQYSSVGQSSFLIYR